MTRWLLRATAALLCLALTRPASALEIPPEIAGDWIVVSLLGDEPAHLQLGKPGDIVGKHLTIGSDTVALWTVLSGRPGAVQTRDGTLDTVVETPPELRASHDFPEAHVPLQFFEIALSDCAENGHPLSGGCPLITLARNPATNTVSLVPFAWALAGLKRVGPAN